MPPELKAQVDALTAWCAGNTADPEDLARALELASRELLTRAMVARVSADRAAKALRAAELVKDAKTPLIPEAAAVAVAAELEAPAKG